MNKLSSVFGAAVASALFLSFLVACSSVSATATLPPTSTSSPTLIPLPTATPISTPTLLPTATPIPITAPIPITTLRPAGTFTDGRCDVPQGKVLFVESSDSKVSLASEEQKRTTCEMLEVYCLGGGYMFEGGRLQMWDPEFKVGPVLIGYKTSCFSSTYSNPSLCVCDDIETAGSLPFISQDGRIVIRAVNGRGAAVVEFDGNTVWLEPGKSLGIQWQAPDNADCVWHHTQMWTNHGLLDESQVEFR